MATPNLIRFAAVCLAFTIVTGCTTTSTLDETASSTNLQRLTADDQADLRAMAEDCRTSTALDLRNPLHHRYIRRSFERAGYTAGRYPQLFRSIETMRTAEPVAPRETAAIPTVPLNEIVDISTNDQISFSTAGYSSVPNGTESTFLTLGLYDAQDRPIGNLARTDQFDGGLQVVLTAQGKFADTRDPGSSEVRAKGTYFFEDRDGNPHAGCMEVASAAIPKKIQNDAPRVTRTGAPTIRICLFRSQVFSDCDYDCSNGINCVKQPPSDRIMRFPVQGYVEYNGNIDVNPDGSPKNALARLTVAFPNTGGQCPKQNLPDFFKPPTVIAGNRITFNFDPAVFGNACYPGTIPTTYALSLQMSIQGSIVGAYINNVGTTPADSTIKIPQIETIIGCLAEGSVVRDARGDARPIESIGLDDTVATPRGQVTVIDKSIGVEMRPMVRLTTANGYTLLLTETHPVMTPKGVRLARDLRAGDRVRTVGGPSRLREVSRESYDGNVWNLHLGGGEDGAVSDEKSTAFYANGILVGDGRMQAYWETAFRRASIHRGVSRRWLEDYHSSLEDRAARELAR